MHCLDLILTLRRYPGSPQERIVAAGDAVQRVLYVTEGPCVAERAAGVVNIEYHQDSCDKQWTPFTSLFLCFV